MSKSLFDGLPEANPVTARVAPTAPRLRMAQRDQIGFEMVDLESLLAPEHPARVVWAYVEHLDLDELLSAVKAREGTPGRPPADPKIPLALWLLATIEGVGSARELDRLCEAHIAYRWICGGVSMNYHALADFRVDHAAFLDRLLARGVAALVSEKLVTLERLSHDGVRLRASAGASSFGRRGRLEKLLGEAEARVAKLKSELDSDPAASRTRVEAARERAARERVARTKAALERMEKLEAERARREKTHKKDTENQRPPRASTTDPQARVMRMPDNGWRPAYNGQIAGDPDTQIVVAVDVETTGSDAGQVGPMLDRIRKAFGKGPEQYLVDGGFCKLDDIESAYAAGIAIFTPPPKNKAKTDPFAPRNTDGPGVAAWRRRMNSPEGQAIYRDRAKHECINAHFRNRGGYRVLVRGPEKVRNVLLWFALAHNLMRAVALRATPHAAATAM